MGTDTEKDFFISYTGADKKWAEWIAWQLEEVQYSTILQSWDFQPGKNFVLEMDQAAKTARRTLVVLSPDYLNSSYAQSEWAVAFRRDPTGEQRAVLPVRVQRCEVEGLLGPIVYIDLVGLDETTAREALLSRVRHERGKPETAPGFPGSAPQSMQHTVPEPQRFPGALPPHWNVPYPRNPYFTGREDILQQLANALRTNTSAPITQPQAISGLGGIGKTQCAVEYAYRFHHDYQAVLWVRAETRELLISDFVAVAELLNLPEKDAQDQNEAVEAVKRYLVGHSEWLLILDNADDLAMVTTFIPPAARGHLLLTTRAQAMGRVAHRIELEQMEPAEGALFLLRRAGILGEKDQLEQAAAAQRSKAQDISQVMDGLPLALDQAGAYLEETSCGLDGYLNLYQQRRAELLARRGGLIPDHPQSVATTWSLSFEQVEQASPTASELLRLCAFLAPDAIPEEIISGGASELGPVLQPVAVDPYKLNAAIEALQKFSLVKRDPDMKTLSIHRLVQAVIRDGMNQQTRRQWAERVVLAVHAALPAVEHGIWPAWERVVAHAQACAKLLERYDIQLPEAAALLQVAGMYLTDRARYPDAEPLLEQAYAMSKRVQGPKHLDTARVADTLAHLYQKQGKYEEAEPLFKRALAIRMQQLGEMHPDTASSLNNLAQLLVEQGKYEEAELLYQRALAIYGQQLGEMHPLTATSLNNLAELYWEQGKYEEAEPLYQHALAISEQQLGPQHPDTAISLNNLAQLLVEQGKYEEAELLYQRALAICEQQLGEMHPLTATSLNNLAQLLVEQGKYEEAELLYQRALVICEQRLGGMHPLTATSLNNLALLYQKQGKYEEAEPLFKRALVICEQRLGEMHPNTAASLNNLALLYRMQSKYEEAEPLFKRALAIYEQQLGPQHPNTATSLNNLAGLYQKQGKYEEAEPLFKRALVICEQQLGPQHPETATSLNNLAGFYWEQGKYEEAESLFERALAIYTKAFGPHHPSTKTIRRNYTRFLEEKKRKWSEQ